MATLTNKNGTDANDILTYSKGGSTVVYHAGKGNDTIKITDGTQVNVLLDAGNNTISVTRGSLHTVKVADNIATGDTIVGADKLTINGANAVDAYLGSGKDIITISNSNGRKSTGALSQIRGGAWGDTFNVNAGTQKYQLYGEVGDDVFNIAGGSDMNFWGGAGRDTFEITGGTNNKVYGGDSEDIVNVRAAKQNITLGYGGNVSQKLYDTVNVYSGDEQTIYGNLGINQINLYAGKNHVVKADIDKALSKKNGYTDEQINAGIGLGYGVDNILIDGASNVTANTGDGKDVVVVKTGSGHNINTEGWGDTIKVSGSVSDSVFAGGAADDTYELEWLNLGKGNVIDQTTASATDNDKLIITDAKADVFTASEANGSLILTDKEKENSLEVKGWGNGINSVQYADGKTMYVVGGKQFSNIAFGKAASGELSNLGVEILNGSVSGAVIVAKDTNSPDSTTTVNATNNHFVLENKSSAGSVSGAEIVAGSAENNTVKITDASVNNSVTAAYVDSGNAKNNSVVLTEGEIGGNVYGGFVGNGEASNNSVTITDSSIINNHIYETQDGSLSDDGGYVYGGRVKEKGDVIGNSVTLESGSVYTLRGGRTGEGNATGNTVTINGGHVLHKAEEIAKETYEVGGINGARVGKGNATENTVIINDGTIDSVVVGARIDEAGAASKNIVDIKGGTINASVFGARGRKEAAVIGNTVNIENATVNGTVFGGRAESGLAADNTINISDSVINGNIWTNRSNDTGATGAGRVDVTNSTINGNIIGGAGKDKIYVIDSTVTSLNGGAGDDEYYIEGANTVVETVYLDNGKDGLNVADAKINSIIASEDNAASMGINGANVTLTSGKVGSIYATNAAVINLEGGSAGVMIASGGGELNVGKDATVTWMNNAEADYVTINSEGDLRAIKLSNGDDTVTITGGIAEKLDLAAGNNTINITGGEVKAIQAGIGEDTINISGGVAQLISNENKDAKFESVNLSGNGKLIMNNLQDVEVNVITEAGETSEKVVGLIGSGLNLKSGELKAIEINHGFNPVTLTNSKVGEINVANARLKLTVNAGANVGNVTYTDSSELIEYASTYGDVTVTGGEVNGNITLSTMKDSFVINGGKVDGIVDLSAGDDSAQIYGTGWVEELNLGAGNDTITLWGDANGGGRIETLHAGEGDDTITIKGPGSVGTLILDSGNNTVNFDWANDTAIQGGTGVDTVNLTGSASFTAGVVDVVNVKDTKFSSVTINGGTIGYLTASAAEAEDNYNQVIMNGGGVTFDQGYLVCIKALSGENNINIGDSTVGQKAVLKELKLVDGVNNVTLNELHEIKHVNIQGGENTFTLKANVATTAGIVDYINIHGGSTTFVLNDAQMDMSNFYVETEDAEVNFEVTNAKFNLGNQSIDTLTLHGNENELVTGTGTIASIIADDDEESSNKVNVAGGNITITSGNIAELNMYTWGEEIKHNTVTINGTAKNVVCNYWNGDTDGHVVADINVAGGNVSYAVLGGGADTMTFTAAEDGSDRSSGTFKMGAGDDVVDVVSYGYIHELDMGDGNDSVTLSNNKAPWYAMVATMKLGAGNDSLTINNGGCIVNDLDAGDGDDTIIMADGEIGKAVLGAGNDEFTINGGVVKSLDAGNGDDIININAGGNFNISGGLGNDTFNVEWSAMTGDMVTLADTAESGATNLININNGDAAITKIAKVESAYVISDNADCAIRVETLDAFTSINFVGGSSYSVSAIKAAFAELQQAEINFSDIAVNGSSDDTITEEVTFDLNKISGNV